MLILFFYLAVISLSAVVFLKILMPEMRKSSSRPVSILPVDLQEEKLEIMLAEKNQRIEDLQAKLSILQAKAQDFDTVKAILEEKIENLREENRSIKSQSLQLNIL